MKTIAKKTKRTPRTKPKTLEQMAQEITRLLETNIQCLGNIARNQASAMVTPSAHVLTVEDSRSKRAQPIVGLCVGETRSFHFKLQDRNSVTVSIHPAVWDMVFIAQVHVGPYQLATGALLSLDVIPSGQWPEGYPLTVEVKRMTTDEVRAQHETGHVLTMVQASTVSK